MRRSRRSHSACRSHSPRHRQIHRVVHSKTAATSSEYVIDSGGRRARMTVLACILGLMAVGVAARLVWLQGPNQQRWATIAQRQYSGIMNILGARGTILDRNGRTLATSSETLTVGAHPRLLKDKSAIATQLASVLDEPQQEILARISTERPFVWLDRDVAPAQREKIEAISPKGLSVFRQFTRFYPQGPIASSLLGKVGLDGDGLSGIELAFNQRLKAEQTEVSVRRDALGKYFRPTGLADDSVVHEAVRAEGNSLALSLDAVLQGIIEKELQQGRIKAEAKSAFAVLMNADTGEILAAAEDIDPAAVTKKAALRNSILQNSYEPGSTFKPIIAAAAFDAGLVNSSEIMDCKNGAMRVGKHTVRDVHPVGKASLRDVLVRSSNVCMAQLGARMGPAKMHKTLIDYGFGSKTGVELFGEAEGILHSVDKWKKIDVATASFGQGIATTALQLVRSYAALANGGYLVQPTILATRGTPVRQRIMKESTARTISEMITGVVSDDHGTARQARISGVTVRGKTGTAQKPSLTSRGYNPSTVLSSFIGYVDGNEVGVSTRLVLYVVVDEPQVMPRWGGRVAAPIFRRSMERILSHLISTQSTVASREGASRDWGFQSRTSAKS